MPLRTQANRILLALLVPLLCVGTLAACSGGVSVSPPGGAGDVSTRANVRIAFARPMDHAAVEARFAIDPPVAGDLAWEGETLVFRPSAAFAAGQTYTVTLAAGAPTARGARALAEIAWQFQVGQPRLLYIARDDVGHYQLYAAGEPAEQLSAGEGDVWDMAVDPTGDRIAYSVARDDGGADLWQVDRAGALPRLLLRCPGASCTAPAWSADGQTIAYERQELSDAPIAVGSGPVVLYIYVLDVAGGETQPLGGEAPTAGRSPTWAPAGARLAFYDLSEQAIQIYDAASGQRQYFDTLGGVGTWDPRGEQMALAEISFHNHEGEGQLVRIDAGTRSVDVIGAPGSADDAMPRWSPDGAWIAFGRASLGDGTPTAGTQLWLMRPDGSEAHPLVVDAVANLGAFAWRPDGAAIAYVRLDLADLAAPRPELWVIELERGEPRLVAAGGILPAWLP
ncbi:MAG: PD40 domain-containing protein [Anaerolineae bacterium]|nr:PD40 domain-containing protein [Anaerolineae bacterium]